MNSNTMTKTTIIEESPDRSRCYEILSEYGTPEHVIGHCKAVAAVAYAIGKAINRKRSSDGIRDKKATLLDLDLILSSGLLHDMARVEDRHWDVAADYCLRNGWARQSEIIRVHMTYDPFNEVEDLNETDVVCLADRVVIEDRYAGLEPRMDYIVNKAIKNGNEEYVPHILRKKEEVGKLVRDLENYLGQSLGSLMKDLNYEDPENE